MGVTGSSDGWGRREASGAERGTFPAGGEAEPRPPASSSARVRQGLQSEVGARGAGGGVEGARCCPGGWYRCRCRCHAAAGGLLSSAQSPRGLQRAVPNPASLRRRRGEGIPGGWGAPPGQPAGSLPCAGPLATAEGTRWPPAWRCQRAGRGDLWGHTCGAGAWLHRSSSERVVVVVGTPPSPPPPPSPPRGDAGGSGTGCRAAADPRTDQAGAAGDRHGGVLQPRRRHGCGVPARAPLELPPHRRGGRVSGAGGGCGGSRPHPWPPHGCPPPPEPSHGSPPSSVSVLQVPGEALRGGAGPPLAPGAPHSPPTPAGLCPFSAPDPALGTPHPLLPTTPRGGDRGQQPPGLPTAHCPPWSTAGGQDGPPQL